MDPVNFTHIFPSQPHTAYCVGRSHGPALQLPLPTAIPFQLSVLECSPLHFDNTARAVSRHMLDNRASQNGMRMNGVPFDVAPSLSRRVLSIHRSEPSPHEARASPPTRAFCRPRRYEARRARSGPPAPRPRFLHLPGLPFRVPHAALVVAKHEAPGAACPRRPARARPFFLPHRGLPFPIPRAVRLRPSYRTPSR